MLYQLNLREVTYALCEALDYVGIDDIKHGKRVAYIACEIAKKLGWRQSKLDNRVGRGRRSCRLWHYAELFFRRGKNN